MKSNIVLLTVLAYSTKARWHNRTLYRHSRYSSWVRKYWLWKPKRRLFQNNIFISRRYAKVIDIVKYGVFIYLAILLMCHFAFYWYQLKYHYWFRSGRSSTSSDIWYLWARYHIRRISCLCTWYIGAIHVLQSKLWSLGLLS